MTRIGLVGLGSWGAIILRDLLALGAEVAVAAPSIATRKRALEHGAISVHASAKGLPEMDGYILAVPIPSHAKVIEALLPRGRPIFVEKPLTADLASAESILARAPDRVFVMDKWRYHGGVLKLAELARQGAVGRLKHVHTWRLGWGNRHRGTNSLWYLGPHDLSIGLEILGTLPPVRRARLTSTFANNCDIAALLGGKRGPTLGLDVSTCHPVNRRSVVLIGTEGSAQLGGSYDATVTLARKGHEPVALPIDTGMPLLAELRAFLGHLDGGPPPKSSAAEATLVVRRLSEIEAMANRPAGDD